MKNILLTSSQHQAIRKHINSESNVAIIVSAMSPYIGVWLDDILDSHLFQQMKAWGYNLRPIILEEISRDEIINQINECDALVISGGNTFYLLQELQKKDLGNFIVDKINSGMPYVGESAGAMILSPDIAYVKPMDDISDAPDLSTTNALWVVDQDVIPHLNRPDGLGKAAGEMISKSVNKLVIEEDQAVLILGDVKSYI